MSEKDRDIRFTFESQDAKVTAVPPVSEEQVRLLRPALDYVYQPVMPDCMMPKEITQSSMLNDVHRVLCPSVKNYASELKTQNGRKGAWVFPGGTFKTDVELRPTADEAAASKRVKDAVSLHEFSVKDLVTHALCEFAEKKLLTMVDKMDPDEQVIHVYRQYACNKDEHVLAVIDGALLVTRSLAEKLGT